MSQIAASGFELKSIADFRNGLNFTKDDKGSGVPIVGVSDFSSKQALDYSLLDRVNGDNIASDEDYLRSGDIIFVRSNGNKDLVGRSIFIRNDEPALFSGFCIRARIDASKIDPLFCYYYTKAASFRKQLAGTSGSNIQNLNQTVLGQVRLPNFSISEQQKIAAILSTLDAKIDLNNRINTELEALAKTVYDYWFVQFEFPDAQGRPYKTSGGKMEWNEKLKREMPEGWGEGELTNIANITMGSSPPGESYNEIGEGAAFFQGSTDFGLRSPQVRQYTTAPVRMAKTDDILLSVRAPVGTMNIADRDCCIGRGLAALNSKDGFDGYLYYVMSYFKQVFDRRNVEGTTFGSINKEDLHGLQVVLPPKSVLSAYDAQVKSWNLLSAINDQKNRELATLRDWLLSLLMNGQVRVSGEINRTQDAI